jgi:hypothetical protein
MAVRTMKSHAICAIQKMMSSILNIEEVQVQDNFIRITHPGFTKHHVRIMVVGYRYKVDFGPSVRPQVHLVDQHQHCSCELHAACPAVKAVEVYLNSGGQRALELLPPCPICGAETFRDRDWDNKYTLELGWRCSVGGLTHFLQAKTEKIKEAFRRKYAATSEHENIAGR